VGFCPQTETHAGPLGQSLGNRSAVLFEMSEFQQSFEDTERAIHWLARSLHPPSYATTKARLYRRRARCMAALGGLSTSSSSVAAVSEKDIERGFDEAEAVAATLDTGDWTAKIKADRENWRTQAAVQDTVSAPANDETLYRPGRHGGAQQGTRVINSTGVIISSGAATDQTICRVETDSLNQEDRSLFMTRNAPAGSVILSEPPFAAVLEPRFARRLCDRCLGALPPVPKWYVNRWRGRGLPSVTLPPCAPSF
jgi:hypothetical protein